MLKIWQCTKYNSIPPFTNTAVRTVKTPSGTFRVVLANELPDLYIG